jgi:hypothetical protein
VSLLACRTLACLPQILNRVDFDSMLPQVFISDCASVFLLHVAVEYCAIEDQADQAR